MTGRVAPAGDDVRVPSLLDRLPPRFRDVPNVGAHSPGAPGVRGIARGANCQLYAYAVLRALGWAVPPLRSSELWADTEATAGGDAEPQPLDLMLFGATDDPFGAHVGLYEGDGRVLHLCEEVGRPVVWTLAEFAARPRYAHVWVKRPGVRVAQSSS